MPSSRIASVGTTLPHTTDSPIDMTPPVGGGGAVLQEYRQNRTVSMLKMNQGIRVIPSRIVRSTHWEALCRPTSPTAPPPGSDNCVIARLPVLVAGLTDQRIDRSVEKRTGLRHNAVRTVGVGPVSVVETRGEAGLRRPVGARCTYTSGEQ